MKNIIRFTLAAILLGATPALAQFGTGQLDSGQIVGNSRSSQGTARAESVTALLDRALASTQGRLLCRNSGGWQSCVAPVIGIPGTAAGSLGIAGVTSGFATIVAQAAAGTPTLTTPNTSGTFAVNATSPLVLSAITGMLTCPTCVTSSGGGAITGTTPINVSGAGVVSINTNGISNSLFRQSAALSIVGRASNSTGDVADISATAGSDCVFRESGSTLACGQVATAGFANDAVTDAKLRNSGPLSVIGRSANSSGDPADISATAASGAVLRESGGILGFGTIATGGIADAAVTYAKIQNLGALELFGRASNSSGVGAGIAASAGSSCAFRESANTISCGTLATAAYANNSVTDAKLRQSAALSLIGRSANSTGDVADISASAGSSCAFRESSNTIACGTLATAAFANNAVSNAKLAQMANNTVKCRVTAGTGDPEDCSASQGRSVLGLGTAAQQNTGTSGANVPLLNGNNTHSGNDAFSGSVDFQASITVSGDITPTQITSNQNDYAPTGFSTASILRISTDASRDITGLAGGSDGRLIWLYNPGSFNAVLKDENASSTAANRFGFGADLTLAPKQGATLIYDSTASRWRQVGGPSSTGGGGGTMTSLSPGPGLQNAGTTSAITTSGTLSMDGAFGFRNRLINPNGKIWQRANSGAAAITDVTYAFDRWYGLTQSNGVTASQVSNAENGTPDMMRLTQANASAQRFGLAQVVENANAIDLRGQSVCASARVRMSASTTLRYAIVEWTGTADTVTKDFVNDWTSGTFTTGNFFTSTSTTITVTGSTALTANTLTTVSACGTVGSSMNNIAVFYWTDSTQAQNVTLDIGKAQLEQGLQATPLAVRSIGDEWQLAQRYFYNGVPAIVGVTFNNTSVARCTGKHPVRMRTSPSLTLTSNLSVFDGTQTITITGVTNYSDASGLNFDSAANSYSSSAGRAASIALNSGGNLNVDAEL